uniref:Metallothionein-like protein n=1 Tax=Oryza meridionalis TaxID=40149 RepID=A0A0E0EMZ5_9ORYZ
MMYRDMLENNTTTPGAMVLGVSPDKGYKFQITTKYTTNIRRIEVSEKAAESSETGHGCGCGSGCKCNPCNC